MEIAPPDNSFRQGRLCALLFSAVFFFSGAVFGESLPAKAPPPEPRERTAKQIIPAEPADTPLPAPRPAVEPLEQTVPSKTAEKPTPRPLPEEPATVDEKPTPRPETDKSPVEGSEEKAGKTDKGPKMEIPPRPVTSPAEEAACRQRLKALGAKFVERPPLSDATGCALPQPLAVKALSDKIDVQPEIVINCATAEAVAKFSTDVVSKLAEQELGSGLKSITQASGYVCRPRNGTHKLSEHAFGNAFDIAAFALLDGTVVEVTATRNPKQSQFLSKLRTAACGPFKTVLGPGSDADHATHFHLDLAKRRNGSTFCQ